MNQKKDELIAAVPESHLILLLFLPQVFEIAKVQRIICNRSGANFIGWFTYLANALYIVAVVKSIAGTQNAVDFMEDKLGNRSKISIDFSLFVFKKEVAYF